MSDKDMRDEALDLILEETRESLREMGLDEESVEAGVEVVRQLETEGASGFKLIPKEKE